MENNAADELARQGALLMPSAIPCSLSLLISCIPLLFSRTEGVLSYLNSSTYTFPRFPLRNLCSLVKLAVLSQSSLQRTQSTDMLLSPGLAESKIFLAALTDTCQDTSPLILPSPATDSLRRSLFGNSLSLQTLVQALGSFPASGAP